MKILHLAKTLTGVNSYIKLITKYNTVFDSTVIVNGHDDGDCEDIKDKNGLKPTVHSIVLKKEINLVKDVISCIQLIRILRQEKPDLIHCHSSKAGLVGRFCGFITGTKTVFTPHAFSFLYYKKSLKRKLAIEIEKRTRFGSFLVACSEYELNVARSLAKYPSEKSFCWSNSIEYLGKSNQEKKRKSVISIGRNARQKNTSNLLNALLLSLEQTDNKFDAYLVGLGENIEDLQMIVEGHPNGKYIHLINRMTNLNLISLLGSSTVYISYSLYEGLPISVLEAMSLGLPLILSDIEGHKECISLDDKNGCLVPLDNTETLSKVILEVLSNENKIKEWGQNSHKLFNAKYNIEATIKNLEGVYSTIIKK